MLREGLLYPCSEKISLREPRIGSSGLGSAANPGGGEVLFGLLLCLLLGLADSVPDWAREVLGERLLDVGRKKLSRFEPPAERAVLFGLAASIPDWAVEMLGERLLDDGRKSRALRDSLPGSLDLESANNLGGRLGGVLVVERFVEIGLVDGLEVLVPNWKMPAGGRESLDAAVDVG